MPLQKENEAKKLVLPTSKDLPENEQEAVLVECGPLKGGDILSVDNFKNQNDFLGFVLYHRIEEWTVKDGDTIAELSLENLKRLPVEDLTFLLGEFIKGDDDGSDVVADPKVTLAA